MFQFLLVGVLVICLTWLYLRWSGAKQYWAKKGVPYASPHPILGSLTFLQKENPSLWMINMYQRFRRSSPYVGIWWFWRPVLLVNSPDLARNILLRDSACFRDRFTRSGASDPVGSLNLFTIKEPHWTPIRRHLTSIFTASKLKGLQNLYDLKTTQLLQRIKTTEDNTKLGLRTLFTDFTTDIIGTAAFGVETNATLTGEDPIRVVTKGFMYMNIFRGICWSCVFFLPECMDIFRFHLFPKSATDYFRKIVGIVSKQRKVENRNPTNPKDLLDALLTLKDAKDIRTNATDEDIVIAQASIFLLGGFETSGSALTFVTYELSFKPEIQEKLYEELIKLKNSSEDGTLDISKLMELEYLNCVVKEVLRKYAPMGWLDRIAARDYQIDDKLTIPAGTPVYVNAIGMHYDEDYFPDPEKFDPDRFLPENEKNIKPYTYMPFGEGPRACVGKRFGLITVRHALSHLVLNYKFQSLPDAPKPNEVELEKYGILMTPFNDVYIKFVPRH